EQETRRAKLQDLLRQVPLARLAASAPGLRCLLQSQLAELALPASDTVEKASESLERFECRITSESIADAAEELAKADYQAPEALDGFAISAALTACELRQKTAEARLAVTGSSDSAKTPLDAEAATKGEAEWDVLQRRAREARDLEETISKRCPHRLSKAIQRLYSQELAAAESMVRFRRLAQWQCVAGLVWRLKSTLPFVALSSLLSMVLGAFSSMRLHYQAAVINLAKDAVTASTGSSKTRPPASVGQTVGAMVVSELIIQLAEFARGRLSLQGKSKVIQELKVALFGALLRQDLEYLEQCDLLQLRSLIGSCGSTISQVVDFPATAVEASVRLGTAVLALSRQNRGLAAFLIIMLPLRFMLSQLLHGLEQGLQDSNALPDFRGQIKSCWSSLVRPPALRTMRAFAREPVELATFARFLAVHDQMQQRKMLVFRLLQPVQALLEHGLEISTLWYGGRLAMRGEMQFGELASVVLIAQNAFDGVRYAQGAAANVSAHALGPLAQMANLLGRTPQAALDEPSLSSMPEPGDVHWDIEFKNVSFEYQQRQGATVLRDLSFRAEEGEFLGILGATGSGKSTILSLLLRLYEPSSGQIFLGGKPLRSYNPLWLRRHIGFVSQDLVLCRRTVRENLLYGCVSVDMSGQAQLEEPTEEFARTALRAAQCEETFFNQAAFPNLWHTDVGDGGSELSGGERQRLALARAIVKKPRLLILDEATSALDEISQAKLQEEVEILRREQGVTVICVAHRLSNLAKADHLLVVKDGELAEEGSPSALLKTDGIFAEYARAHQAVLQDS
ncbi:Abcb10, partial [Symbiodinium necroappetens]